VLKYRILFWQNIDFGNLDLPQTFFLFLSFPTFGLSGLFLYLCPSKSRACIYVNVWRVAMIKFLKIPAEKDEYFTGED
jgi:hypothetical protein